MLKHRAVPRTFVLFTALVVAIATCPAARGDAALPSQHPSGGGPAASAAGTPGLEALAWLRGCWLGSVNRREFLEQWSPPRGGMMVGFSHTVVAPDGRNAFKAENAPIDPNKAKTQDFEYLRLEQRPDGVYYVAVPSGSKEVSFKLTEVSEDSGAKIFTFTNAVDEFPQRLVYRRGKEGWLYAQVAGKPGGTEHDVIYPMQHVDCLSDALLKE
ncbi:MAG TPA: DUF6265 family protein [Casimicrobiaceae bacterium]|nr:DUF6265 family protein [Casimicrobiaceae bacterium]